MREVGRCSEVDLDEGFGCVFGSAEEDGRLCSVPLDAGWPTGVGAGVAEVNGAAKLFFMREKREETSAYEELSCSSSSAKGLNEVRQATSSSALVLLRALPMCTDDSMVWSSE